MTNQKDKEDEKDQLEVVKYPEGQEYIRNIVKPYREKIWQLNEQIDKLDQKQQQEPRKQTLTFNPPGYLQTRVPPAYNRDILVGQREDIQKQLDKRVGVETKELEPDGQAAAKEAVRDDVDRNPFAGKSKEELDKIKGESKDLSQSQNYNMTLLKNYRKDLEEKTRSIQTETKDQSDAKSSQKESQLNPSERYNRTLSYTKAVETGRELTQKEIPTPQKSIGKDER